MSLTLTDYLKTARPDHWLKNVMIVPGGVLAMIIENKIDVQSFISLFVAILATCFIASANYTINEYLDRDSDRHHPIKSFRAFVSKQPSKIIISFQYFLCTLVGFFLLSKLNTMAFAGGASLLIMGIIYNAPPLRSKDLVFVDVLSESINNPLRLIIGWASVTTIILPPISLIVSFWLGGAFLMATKRYAEYRFINNSEKAGLYRKSFNHYTELSLSLSAFFYAILCVFFLAVFLIKYRIEFLLSFPFIAVLFTWYLGLASLHNTKLEWKPETIFHNKKFFTYVIMLAAFILILFFWDLPSLHFLSDYSVLNDMRLE